MSPLRDKAIVYSPPLSPSSSSSSSSRTNYLVIFILILIYYPLSIGLTFYQKWFIKDYSLPLFVVCGHYIFKLIAAQMIRSGEQFCCRRRIVSVTWMESIKVLAPIGICAAVDIGLSNWALEYITVSLYTMSKASSIVYILIFCLCLGLEKFGYSLVSIVFLISFGLFLFTFRSTQWNTQGFLLVELAAFCSGLRWTIAQSVMSRDEMGLRHPVDMICAVQPWMIVGILPLIFIFEGSSLNAENLFRYRNQIAPFQIFSLILIGGLIAFSMEIAEYLLLLKTSSLTLNMFGIVKEMVTLALAHQLNGDTFGIVNMIGLTLCLIGIGAHGVVKATTSDKMIDEYAMKKESTIIVASGSLLTTSRLSTDEASNCLLNNNDDDDDK